MMLSALINALVPKAFAVTLEQLGASNGGVSAMWGEIKSIFPHTDWGSQGPVLLMLKVVAFVLTLIGGAAVAVIVFGGIRMTMFVLDENGVAETKKMVMYALIGVVLAIASNAIILYVERLVSAAAGA
jgi:hypothetical protein